MSQHPRAVWRGQGAEWSPGPGSRSGTADDAAAEPSPGTAAPAPRAASSLHPALAEDRSVAVGSVSPVEPSPFPAPEVRVPTQGHRGQAQEAPTHCPHAHSPSRSPCSYWFSDRVFRPSSSRLILRHLEKLPTPRKLILRSSGEASLPLTISTWNRKNLINSSCLLRLHKAPDYGLPFYYSLL